MISDDVDVEATTDMDGGYDVGWNVSGEWLEYDLQLTPGTYQVQARVSSVHDAGSFELSLDGSNALSGTSPDTGGWQNWVTVDLGVIVVTDETASLRIDITGSDFNLNWVQFTGVAR